MVLGRCTKIPAFRSSVREKYRTSRRFLMPNVASKLVRAPSGVLIRAYMFMRK